MGENKENSSVKIIYNVLLILLSISIVLCVIFAPFIQIKTPYGIFDIDALNFAYSTSWFYGLIEFQISNGMEILRQNLMPLILNDGTWIYQTYTIVFILLIIICVVNLIFSLISLLSKKYFKLTLLLTTCVMLPISLILYWSPLLLWVLSMPFEKEYSLLVIPFIPEIIGFMITIFSSVILIIYEFNFKIKKEEEKVVLIPLEESNEIDELRQLNNTNKIIKNPAKTSLNDGPIGKNTAKPNLNGKKSNKKIVKSHEKYGDYYYYQNMKIKEIIIEEDITTLGKSCFEGCFKLSKITLPKSLIKIENKCFYKCNNLSEIFYSGTVEEFQKILRGAGWLAGAKTRIVKCINGEINVNPYR